jgi:hypothetical protein
VTSSKVTHEDVLVSSGVGEENGKEEEEKEEEEDKGKDKPEEG